MSLILTTVHDVFFQPLEGLAAASPNARPCPDFSDHEFLHLGIQRVLTSESGRAFLQEHGLRFQNAPGLGNYFAALKSKRRGLVTEITEKGNVKPNIVILAGLVVIRRRMPSWLNS